MTSSADRAGIPTNTREASGVHTRRRDQTFANRAEDVSLESLVKMASSFPPPADDVSTEFEIPPLLPMSSSPLEDMMVQPLSIRVPASHRSTKAARPTRSKWLVVLPWALLAVGGVAAFAVWPRHSTVASAEPSVRAPSEPTYALAPIPPPTESGATAPLGTDQGIDLNDIVIVETAAQDDERSEVAAATATPATPVVADSVAVVPVAEPAPVAPVETVAVATDVAVDALSPVDAAPVGPAAPVTAAPALEAPTDPTVLSTAERIRAHMGGVAAPTSASAPGTASAAPAIPARPSRSEVARALRSVASAVDACTANVGAATIRITVANDGSVSAASATGEYAGTSEGACMAQAVRSARFALFTDSSLVVSYPFSLR